MQRIDALADLAQKADAALDAAYLSGASMVEQDRLADAERKIRHEYELECARWWGLNP